MQYWKAELLLIISVTIFLVSSKSFSQETILRSDEYLSKEEVSGYVNSMRSMSPTELDTDEYEFLNSDLSAFNQNDNNDFIRNLNSEDKKAEKKGAHLIAFVPGFNRVIPIVAPEGTGAAMMSKLKGRMQRDPEFSGRYDDWFMVTYNQYADAESIADQIESQLVRKITAHGTTDVKVDLVTHSLGSPAAMFGAANDEVKMTDNEGNESWVSQHIGMVVNLSGANFGQDQNETFGSQVMAQLQPYVSKHIIENGIKKGAANNRWLHNWFVHHRNSIANWDDICAMWSKQDQMVKSPHDAGAIGISRHGLLYTQPARSFSVTVPIPRFMSRAHLMTVHIRWLAGGRTRASQNIHNIMYQKMKSSCWGLSN